MLTFTIEEMPEARAVRLNLVALRKELAALTEREQTRANVCRYINESHGGIFDAFMGGHHVAVHCSEEWFGRPVRLAIITGTTEDWQ